MPCGRCLRLSALEFPFAFESRNRVSFREVNFGERQPDGAPMTIAGVESAASRLCHLP